MPSFIVFRLWHTYAGSRLNRVLKKDILAAKSVHALLKNILFKPNFDNECHLDS